MGGGTNTESNHQRNEKEDKEMKIPNEANAFDNPTFTKDEEKESHSTQTMTIPLHQLCPEALESLGACSDVEIKVDLNNLPNIPVVVIGEPPPLYEETEEQDEEAGEEVTVTEDDPWAVLDEASAFKPWSESNTKEKVLRVTFYCTAPFLVLGMLYFFICSLDMLTSAFRLLAGRAAGAALTFNEVLSNPICGLMIGILVTVVVQSSSTSISIVVAMVSSGVLQVQPAIPIMMGANIGTTITSLLVALTQSVDRNAFRRAFAGAGVHNVFNLATCIILLPLEAAFGFLYYMTHPMASSMGAGSDTGNPDFLKALTNPLTDKIVQLDASVITAIAEESPKEKYPMIKTYCTMVNQDITVSWPGGNDSTTGECIMNETVIDTIDVRPYAIDFQFTCSDDTTWMTYNDILEDNCTKCSHLFVDQGVPGAALSELESGLILFFCSIIAFLTCLIVLVKVLNTLLKGPMAKVVRRVLNADFPGYASCLTGYVALFLGAGVTVLVQSCSVTTSVFTPLVGMGLITVERIYPLVLGANLGSTVTAILAALTADAGQIVDTMQLAFSHMFFNLTGIIIFYPIPFLRKLPIFLSKKLGNITSKYRWFAAAYVLMFFFIIPGCIFGLSMAGWQVFVGIAVPIATILLLVIIINLIQYKNKLCLPTCLQSWDCLPLWMRSLQPMDNCITAVCANRHCRTCCSCCYEGENMENVVIEQNIEDGNCEEVVPQQGQIENGVFLVKFEEQE